MVSSSVLLFPIKQLIAPCYQLVACAVTLVCSVQPVVVKQQGEQRMEAGPTAGSSCCSSQAMRGGSFGRSPAAVSATVEQCQPTRQDSQAPRMPCTQHDVLLD
jgi:hypothetical protein